MDAGRTEGRKAMAQQPRNQRAEEHLKARRRSVEGTRGEPRGDDTMRQYLTEIGRFRLLTREEEVALSKRIEQHDQDAKNRLVESNLRLVFSIAKRYTDRGLALL